MPVTSCQENGKPGYRWGSSGKCYTYTAGNESSKNRARSSAERQGRAARAGGYQGVYKSTLEELLEDAPGGGFPEAYRPATADDVPEGRACGNCVFFNENILDEEGRAWCEWWEDFAQGGFYCDAWVGEEYKIWNGSLLPVAP